MEGTIGEIRGFAGNFAPRDWAYCAGQTLQIQQYTPLFAIIGTMYGGNGQTTFQLPNLIGRVPIGTGAGSSFGTIDPGMTFGQKQMILTTANMPVHNHPVSLAQVTVSGTATGNVNIKCLDDQGDQSSPKGNALSKISNGYVGGSDATDSMTPMPATLNVAATLAGNAVVGNTGSSLAFDVVQPSLGINWIICLQGIFPSRE